MNDEQVLNPVGEVAIMQCEVDPYETFLLQQLRAWQALRQMASREEGRVNKWLQEYRVRREQAA